MKRTLTALSAVFLTAPVVVAGESRTVTLEVANMYCAACPITVRKVLERVPGVGSANVDPKTRPATVVFEATKTSPQALTKATTDAGFPSTVAQVQ